MTYLQRYVLPYEMTRAARLPGASVYVTDRYVHNKKSHHYCQKYRPSVFFGLVGNPVGHRRRQTVSVQTDLGRHDVRDVLLGQFLEDRSFASIVQT